MISLGEASPTESRHELGHDVIARRRPEPAGGLHVGKIAPKT